MGTALGFNKESMSLHWYRLYVQFSILKRGLLGGFATACKIEKLCSQICPELFELDFVYLFDKTILI